MLQEGENPPFRYTTAAVCVCVCVWLILSLLPRSRSRYATLHWPSPTRGRCTSEPMSACVAVLNCWKWISVLWCPHCPATQNGFYVAWPPASVLDHWCLQGDSQLAPGMHYRGSLFLAVVFSTLYTADLPAVVFSNYQYCYFASCCIAGRSLSLSSRFAVSCGLLQWVVGLQWCRLFVLKAEVVACCAPLASAGPGYVYHVWMGNYSVEGRWERQCHTVQSAVL